MPLIALLFLFAGPVFQIIFLTLKIKGRIKIAPGVIAVLTFISGIVLSVVSMYLVDLDIHPDPSGFQCGVIPMAVLFAGVFIIAVATPIIELIFFVIKRVKGKNSLTINDNV